MVTLVNPRQQHIRRGDIQRHRQLKRTPAPDSEAGVLKHPEHRPVICHHLRIKTVDPAVRRELRELLEHPSPDPTSLIIISHRKRDFGDARLAQRVILSDSHHPAVVATDQRETINPPGLRGRARDSIGTPKTMKTEVPALRREAVIKRLDVPIIRRHRGLQPQREPITQQHIPDQPWRFTRPSDHHTP
jgi:hypothetical protein